MSSDSYDASGDRVPEPDVTFIPSPPPYVEPLTGPIAIQSPQDLLTAIPYLLHYQPNDALVIVLLCGRRIAFAAIMEFSSPSDASHLWEEIAPRVFHESADSVYLVAYAPDSLTETVRECMRTSPLPVNDVLRVCDGHWWGLLHDDPACRSVGTPIEAQDHVVAALASSGHSVAASRAHLAASLRPAPDAALDRVHAEIVSGASEEWTATDRYQALWAAHQARLDGPLTLDEATAGRLLRALSHAWVRAACRDWHDDASWWLWNDLIRLTPTSRVAMVVTHLAAAAYQRGDISMALTATEHALDADPEFMDAQALMLALTVGLPRDEFYTATHNLAEEARRQLRGSVRP